MKWVGLFLILTVLNFLQAQIADINDKEFYQYIQQTLVLVDFYASWCVPCKWQEDELQALQDSLRERVVIVRIDAEKFSSVAHQYAIQYYPTLILFSKSKALKKWIGLQKKEELLKFLKPML